MTTLSEGLKTIFLAGVGAVAVTAEKSKEIIDDLVKKGELTMEQGKVLNEELKRDSQPGGQHEPGRQAGPEGKAGRHGGRR